MKLNDLSDEAFLDLFFDDELTDELMEELDTRLTIEGFEAKYNSRLKENFNRSPKKMAIDYLPMILFLALIVIGIYLTSKMIV